MRARFEQLGASPILIFREDVVGGESGDVVFGEGALAMPRRDPYDPRRSRYAVYRYGIFEALRACIHAREGYGSAVNGERSQIRVSEETAADLLRLLGRWSTLDDAQRGHADELTARLVAHSERWRNLFKRRAAEFFEDSIYVADALGRTNPTATRAKIVAARRALTVRLTEVAAIAPWMGYREAALYAEMERIHTILLSTWDALSKLDREALDTVRSSDVVRTAQEFRTLANQLASVHVEPFITNFGEASRELESAARHVIRGRMRIADETMHRARNGLRFKFAQFELEELLRHVAIAVDVAQLREVDCAALCTRVAAFRERVYRLRDQQLRHDPYPEINQHITRALDALRKGEPEPAKDALKSASHAM